LWTDDVLWFCFAFFFFREIVQMAGEKIGYKFNVKNMFEITNLVFLAPSIDRSRLRYNLRTVYSSDSSAGINPVNSQIL
jgi:hypothetical protein